MTEETEEQLISELSGISYELHELTAMLKGLMVEINYLGIIIKDNKLRVIK